MSSGSILPNGMPARPVRSSRGHCVRRFDGDDGCMTLVMHELAQHEQGRSHLAPRASRAVPATRQVGRARPKPAVGAIA